jgi:hypothetical protein
VRALALEVFRKRHVTLTKSVDGAIAEQIYRSRSDVTYAGAEVCANR